MAAALFPIDPTATEPLVAQIVAGLSECIRQRRLRPGSKAPSIRAFARDHGVSTFTVVEAYDRLVAQGLLMPRRGAGFFIADGTAVRDKGRPPTPPLATVDGDWLLRQVYEQADIKIHAGCGWLPETWHDTEAVGKALRQVARDPAPLVRYGQPKGYPRLRETVARQLAEWEVEAPADRVVLTVGASQALDLVVQATTRPGDVVLVESPGYGNLFAALRLRGLRLIGVPMTPSGPDLTAMAELAAEHAPRLFFTNPQLQNPTGASYATATAFEVLRLAERHGFRVVEDAVSLDLVAHRVPTLAGMDPRRQVIYVGSFSKAVAPGLRVGFVTADAELVERLLYHKLVAGMATSEINERAVQAIVDGGHLRKQLEQLRSRLTRAHEKVGRRLEDAGFTLFTRPDAGMFVWARPREAAAGWDPLALSRRAAAEGVLLAPGCLFEPALAPSPWMRFNVAYCDDDRLFQLIAEAM